MKELHVLATEPQKSPYLDALVPAVLSSQSELQKKAQRQLSGILHDYSAFAVSTIDKFFQQTLRAFSREIGQFTSYQVQLDRDALVAESVDRLLDNLTEEGDGKLLKWLTESAQEDLSQKGTFSLEKNLTVMAASLRDLPEGKDIPRETLGELRKTCRQVITDFEKRLKSSAEAALQVFADAGLDPEETIKDYSA